MELMLLESIPGVGRQYQIVTVSDYDALNVILPSRKALVPTAAVRQRYGERIREAASSTPNP